ncbi:MAG: ComEC/Rec2 family competence protein [Beijerinckiaceae bacterium]
MGRGRGGSTIAAPPEGLARPAPWGGRAAGASGRPFSEGVRAALAHEVAIEAQARRPFLWLPVFFGAGAVLYFAAEREPPLWPALIACMVFALAAVRARRTERMATMRFALAAAFMFAGFAAGAVQTRMAAAPVIDRQIVARATGYVESIDARGEGARLLVRVGSIAGLTPAQTPERIRVNMRGRPDFESGATIAATMRLLPPPSASVPNGYDFAREAWFRQIGAVGNLVSRPELAPASGAPASVRAMAAIDRARNALTQRIAESIGGAKGAVAAALVTGKRGLIPEATNEDLRAAGIYHVVSISGLHMMLAAGIFLWSLRALLALFPAIALRRPIKKWAAAFAILGAFAYNLFSGSEVATERSMIMIVVMLGATLADRPAISMRNLAIAALVVLAIDPSTVLGPSFQMSFGAVAAMVAVYERKPGKLPKGDLRERPAGAVEKGLTVLGAMIVTTLVAALATDPFGAYHFNRVSMYGLVGNALVLPLVEFVVMPAAVFGVIASFFGLDAPVWFLMGQGVGFMLHVAGWVAELPGAVRMTPSFGPGALVLMALGLLWLTLWQSRLRWLGVAISASGVALAVTARQPDLLADARGQALAYRGVDGRLHALNPRGDYFTLAQWLAGDADPREPRTLEKPEGAGCDRSGCIGLLKDGRVVALVLERAAMPEDCARADIVVTRLHTRGACAKAPLVLDGAHFDAFGATRVFWDGTGSARLVTARTARQDRPWSRAPKPGPAQPPTQGDGDPQPDAAYDWDRE